MHNMQIRKRGSRVAVEFRVCVGPDETRWLLSKGKAQFDKAVVCDGNTITYNFNKPW